jgi:hypothetical protein
MAQNLQRFNIDSHNDVTITPYGKKITNFEYLDWFNLDGQIGRYHLYEHRFLHNQNYRIDEEISISREHIIIMNNHTMLADRPNFLVTQLYLVGGFYDMNNVYEILRIPIDESEYNIINILLFGPEFIKIYG